MSRRRGLTLIELVIVIVIIAILAAIAIPQFKKTSDKAHTAAMRADLANLARAEEAFQADKGSYTADVSQLDGFRFSTGVTLAEPMVATPSGWAARVVHPQVSPYSCALFFGATPPLPPASENGIVACGPP